MSRAEESKLILSKLNYIINVHKQNEMSYDTNQFQTEIMSFLYTIHASYKH